MTQVCSKSDVLRKSCSTSDVDTELAFKIGQNKDIKVAVHNFLIQSFRVKVFIPSGTLFV